MDTEGGARLRVRPPSASEALMVFALAHQLAEHDEHEEAYVRAAADLDDALDAWWPVALRELMQQAPTPERLRVALDLVEDADDPYAPRADDEAGTGEGEGEGDAPGDAPRRRLGRLLQTDWDSLACDLAAMYGTTPLAVLSWPWGVVLRLSELLPQQEARQIVRGLTVTTGQHMGEEALGKLYALAYPDAAQSAASAQDVVTVSTPEQIAAARAQLHALMGHPPPSSPTPAP